MIELHPPRKIVGNSAEEALSLVSKEFSEESYLNIKLTTKNLVEQAKVVTHLFLQGKNITFDLPQMPHDKLARKAYAQLKMLQPYLNVGLENLLISDAISPDFKKKLFRQLSNDAQTEVIERIYQNGKISKIEHIFPKLAWLAKNKDLPNGLAWIIHQKNFLPSVKKYWNKFGTIRGNWFVFGDKPDGVEEGFMATPADQAFFAYFYEMLELNKELHPKAYQEFQPAQTLKTLIQKIQKASPHGKKFLTELSLEMWGQTKKSEIPVDIYMFKQDYEGKKRSARQKAFGQNGSYVSPSINRLKKDPFIKETLPVLFHRIAAEIKKRFKTLQLPQDQNTNAIVETLVNDLLKMFGFDTQDQKIVYSSYEDGSPKILSACLWKKGAKPGKNYLRGNHSPNYEGYFVKNPELENELDIFESMTIQFGGTLFVSALVSGDRDFVGWDGNNKMILILENLFKLFSIDPGLALREESSILDHLGTDFSFLQPLLLTYKYKNLSALTDNPITEKIMGMLILYYIMPHEWRPACFDEAEIQAIDASFQFYQEAYPEFSELINQLKPQGLGDTYKKYWEYLAIQLDDEALPAEWREQCAHALHQIDAAFGRLARNTTKLMHTFKQRMALEPQEVTLLDFWEKKFSDEVSDYSPCGTIKLNHTRVVSGRAIFEMQKHRNKAEQVDGILLNIPLNKKKEFLQYLNQLIGNSKFQDRTTFWDTEGKILLSAENFKLLSERALDPNGWIDQDIQEFYQQHLLQKSPEEIESFINEIPDENKRNEALQALANENPQIRETLCCKILKERLLLKQNENAIQIDLPEETFAQKLNRKLQEAAEQIMPQLTTDQSKHLKEEIKTITQKVNAIDALIDSSTLLGEIFMKQIGLKHLQSLYQTFDTHYSKGFPGFFGGQTAMRREFFNISFSIFEENPVEQMVPVYVIKQRFKKFEEDLQQSCSKELFENHDPVNEHQIIVI